MESPFSAIFRVGRDLQVGPPTIQESRTILSRSNNGKSLHHQAKIAGKEMKRMSDLSPEGGDYE
jgi:hypothetical protein